MSYGQKIREIRRRELMSQEAFADKVGVSRSVISQIEIDRIRPSLEMLRNVSREFDVSLDFLMLYEDEPEKDDTQMTKNQSQNPEEDPVSLLSLKVMPALANRFMSEPGEKINKMHHLYERRSEIAFEGATDNRLLLDESKEKYSGFHLQQVPLVRLEQFEEYNRMSSKSRWINDLPKLTLPVSRQQHLLAFEMNAGQEGEVLPRNIAVCSPGVITKITIGQEVLIWFHRPIPIFATIEQIDEYSFVANGASYRNRDIAEIWRIEFLLSNNTSNTSLQQQLARVEAKLDGLMKKG